MKIGMFGGSFNPIHNAHLHIAKESQRIYELEKIIFIPAADPPHKILDGGISFDTRSNMVKLAIEGNPQFELSTIEWERSGKSYSVDTITTFVKRCPEDELYFIIGSDSYIEIGTWHRYAEIFALCNLIVFARPTHLIEIPYDLLPTEAKGDFIVDSDSSDLIHKTGRRIKFLKETSMELSSTKIRQLLLTGAEINHLVPPAVAGYIKEQRIYN